MNIAMRAALPALLLFCTCVVVFAAECPADRVRSCEKCQLTTATCRSGPGCRKGKATIARCTSCKPNAKPRKGSNPPICDCKPGFFLKGTECEPCSLGSFCTGGSATNPDAVASECQAGLTTMIVQAMSEAACVTLPGVGRVPVTGTDGKVTYVGEQCEPGTYNVGGNTAACTSCGTGLTTDGAGKSSEEDCGAPAGSFVASRDVGRLCSLGTYTPTFNKLSKCFKCSEGATTEGEGGTICNRALAGYFYAGDGKATPCPLNTYNDEVTDATSCKTCPTGFKTVTTGSTACTK